MRSTKDSQRLANKREVGFADLAFGKDLPEQIESSNGRQADKWGGVGNDHHGTILT